MDNEIKRKAELFDFLLENFSCTVERRRGGARKYCLTIRSNTLCKDSQDFIQRHDDHVKNKSRGSEYDNYLRLKAKYESNG